MVRMVQPAYAQLGMHLVVSYRPSPEKVAAWHTVMTRNGRVDSFMSIADQHSVPAARLIEFNFPGSTSDGRVNPDIVNWYLYHHREFQCRVATHDGNNYLFKGGERIAVPFLGTVEIGEPIFAGDVVASMSPSYKLSEAMTRSLPYLPDEAAGIVKSMLTPEAFALIAATLLAWAASHFFGVGEIVDVILLGVGVVTIGFAVFEGAKEFGDFVSGAVDAKSFTDLDEAGRHFARAVTLLGIATIQALLMKGPAQAAARRGAPRIQPRMQVGRPPTPGEPVFSRPATLGGSAGRTSPFGIIKIARNQSLSEQRITLLHELVHRFFSPRTGPLLRLRAELRMSAYSRSAFLAYLEEALAEGYGQLRINGLADALAAYRFPIDGGYVTVSQLATEGAAIGSIILGGARFYVSITLGPLRD